MQRPARVGNAAPKTTVRAGYTRPSWKALCREMIKFQVELPQGPGPDSGDGPADPEDSCDSGVTPSQLSGITQKTMEPAGIESRRA